MEAPSLRETLESAISADAEPVEAPAIEAAAEPVVEAAPAPADARARDESGRFAPKTTEKPAAAPKGAQRPATEAGAASQGKAIGAAPSPAPVAEPVTPAAPAVKAPQSWTPQAREAFAKAPPEVQAEAVRREREHERVLRETAPVRQYAQQVQESLRPYESIARANGMDAMSWAGNALQMVASLYAGTPQQRAQTIAKAIQLSGADLGAIDAALQGQGQAAPQGQPQQVDVARLVEERFQSFQAQQEQQATLSEAQRFLANPPEFWETVQPDALFILERDRRNGGNMTPQQAYDSACRFNEDVQSVLASRKATEAARAQAPTVQRAKVAASSIRGTPATPVTRAAGPRSLRDDLEAAVAAQRT